MTDHSARVRASFANQCSLATLAVPDREVVEERLGLDPAIARLRSSQPDMLTGFGSAIAALFTHLDATGETFHRPRLVRYGSEGLPMPVRQMLMSKYGIEVFSAYNAVEAFQTAWECEAHDGYHINADQYPLRVVNEGGDDASGCDLAPGEYGEIVLSNLVNRGTVLLNYRTGDLAALLDEPCPCGRHLPRISWIEGRTADALVALDGRRIPSRVLAAAVFRSGGVWQFQAVQEARDHVLVRLRPGPDCDQAVTAARLTGLMQDALGAGVTVDVTFADELARTPAGKRRYVINEINSQKIESPGDQGPHG